VLVRAIAGAAGWPHRSGGGPQVSSPAPLTSFTVLGGCWVVQGKVEDVLSCYGIAPAMPRPPSASTLVSPQTSPTCSSSTSGTPHGMQASNIARYLQRLMEFVFGRGQRSNWIERTEISIQFLCIQPRGRGDTERKDLQRRLYSDNPGAGFGSCKRHRDRHRK
jgi:hypothetical protein